MSSPSLDDAVSTADEERVDQVLAIVREVLSKPDITADDEVTDHGGTSLAIVRILSQTSRVLGLNINPRDLNGSVTARSLVKAAR